ncbi:fucolectin-3-like isoform X1 [Asterias amurensis]|uniref:fucolectin-3-like isoform X1 n=1 Tax=Asterias amurensis TaxID=7602 RepID=UPI003AB73F72
MARLKGILLEKNLLIYLFGILVCFCPLGCWGVCYKAVDLLGKTASQESNYYHVTAFLTADLAIDGDSRTLVNDFTCSLTKFSPHAWWKVDLGADHLLGRITIVKRGDGIKGRLTGALVRVGIDSDIFNNAVCGSAVTWDQASIPGVHIQVVCDPPVITRYVSVDNKANATALDGVKISLCEVMVEEVRPEEECPKTTIKSVTEPSFTKSCMSTLLYNGKCVNDPGPLLDEVTSRSPMQCFLSCKKNNECLYFDYVTTSGQCRLYDVKAGDLEAIDEPGCLLYMMGRG